MRRRVWMLPLLLSSSAGCVHQATLQQAAELAAQGSYVAACETYMLAAAQQSDDPRATDGVASLCPVAVEHLLGEVHARTGRGAFGEAGQLITQARRLGGAPDEVTAARARLATAIEAEATSRMLAGDHVGALALASASQAWFTAASGPLVERVVDGSLAEVERLMRAREGAASAELLASIGHHGLMAPGELERRRVSLASRWAEGLRADARLSEQRGQLGQAWFATLAASSLAEGPGDRRELGRLEDRFATAHPLTLAVDVHGEPERARAFEAGLAASLPASDAIRWSQDVHRADVSATVSLSAAVCEEEMTPRRADHVWVSGTVDVDNPRWLALVHREREAGQAQASHRRDLDLAARDLAHATRDHQGLEVALADAARVTDRRQAALAQAEATLTHAQRAATAGAQAAATVAAWERARAARSRAVAAASEALDTERARLAAARDALSQAQTRVRGLGVSCGEVDDRASGLKATAASLRTELQEGRAAVASLDREIETARTRAQQRTAMGALVSSRAVAAARVEQLQTALASVRAERPGVEAGLAACVLVAAATDDVRLGSAAVATGEQALADAGCAVGARPTRADLDLAQDAPALARGRDAAQQAVANARGARDDALATSRGLGTDLRRQHLVVDQARSALQSAEGELRRSVDLHRAVAEDLRRTPATERRPVESVFTYTEEHWTRRCQVEAVWRTPQGAHPLQLTAETRTVAWAGERRAGLAGRSRAYPLSDGHLVAGLDGELAAALERELHEELGRVRSQTVGQARNAREAALRADAWLKVWLLDRAWSPGMTQFAAEEHGIRIERI